MTKEELAQWKDMMSRPGISYVSYVPQCEVEAISRSSASKNMTASINLAKPSKITYTPNSPYS